MLLRIFTCTDHKGHWPVGVASVVIARDEGEARRLLDVQLLEDGLDVTEYSLCELPANEPRAVVLANGEY